MCKSTSNTFYAGAKKLLGKQTIQSLCIHDGSLFAGGSSVDGTAGKVCSYYIFGFYFIGICMVMGHNVLILLSPICLWKVFSLTSKAVVGSFSTGLDIQHIAVNSDFIFTATKCGMIEVWLKERVTRVASIRMGGGGHAKNTSLISDTDGEMLFAGSSDGKIQVKNSIVYDNILKTLNCIHSSIA